MPNDDYAAPHLVDEIANLLVPDGAVAIWWIGQGSFILKGGGTTVYVDPYLRVSERRLSPPPFAPAAATNADLVLLTHDHGDHVDPSTLPDMAAASPRARFVAPRPIVGRVAELVGGAERVTPAVADERLSLDAVEVLPVPAKHDEFDRTTDGDYPYLGYTVRLGGVTLHFAADTIAYEGQVERVKPHAVDVAFVPINGRDFYRTRANTIGNMDYREAAEFVAQIGANLAVPVHYGMFRHNTVPPGHFVDYLHEFHPEQSCLVMGRFGRFVYARPSAE
jgi:L-ascorbate 6-phosphate lactonase